MKKLILLFVGILLMPTIYAQDINDALRYSSGEITGTARFRALSGAFGALGGDLSAVNINPASSSVFANSNASFTLGSLNIDNDVSFFEGRNSNSESDIKLQQGGGAFVFKNRNENSKWKKFALSIAYDNTRNYEDNWFAKGTNGTDTSNGNSIGDYFLNITQGLRLDEISALPGETVSQAYSEIGNIFGYTNQQAFLGYDSFILEPDTPDDDNTSYTSNIANGKFSQEYSLNSTGYNGKVAFNASALYGDNFYFGLNLNSHFLNYERSTFLFEENDNTGSLVNQVGFENNISVNGSGFSFQIGTIFKVAQGLRLGLTYDSPTWMTIEEETTQYIETVRNEGGTDILRVLDPQVLNVFPQYKLQSPGKITGSLAYIFGTNGLINFDYSRKDYSNIKFKPTSDAYFSDQNLIINNNLKAASTYKVGGEYKIKRFSLRGGYRFEESPYKNETTIGDLRGYSLGLGYKFGNTTIDLTYDQSKQSRNHQLFNTGLVDAVTIDNVNSNITLSLGFQL
ncbi:OmpP1/FadL family transporter [uncultured Lacinutrix sp.]|uniref:OmpP1/FadL family transporter n=1 Tax=uncultured Lacinutrix sp. TaxID=574032 RepID=UPI002615FFF5|nr:outer membrane protein transport protein [uncultured Lacinutrix sp.]